MQVLLLPSIEAQSRRRVLDFRVKFLPTHYRAQKGGNKDRVGGDFSKRGQAIRVGGNCPVPLTAVASRHEGLRPPAGERSSLMSTLDTKVSQELPPFETCGPASSFVSSVAATRVDCQRSTSKIP